jgi:hypothetical protein
MCERGATLMRETPAVFLPTFAGLDPATHAAGQAHSFGVYLARLGERAAPWQRAHRGTSWVAGSSPAKVMMSGVHGAPN